MHASRSLVWVTIAVAVFSLMAAEVALAEQATQPAVGTIRGRVVDAVTGQVIPRARLRLTAYGMTAAADDAGVYVFTGVPVGATTLLASAPGYQDYAQNIEVFAGAQTLDVLMVPVGTQTTRQATLGEQRPDQPVARGPSTVRWILMIGAGVLLLAAVLLLLRR